MNDEVPCKPTCPICTDDSPPEKWNGPYTAYRWSLNALVLGPITLTHPGAAASDAAGGQIRTLLPSTKVYARYGIDLAQHTRLEF